MFAFFLILKAIDILGFFYDMISPSLLYLEMIKNLLVFLQLPIFYLYILSVCYADFTITRKHLLHSISFFLVNLVLIPRFYLVDVASKINLLENHKNVIELQFTHVFLHLQVAFYLILVFAVLRRAKKVYVENYTSASIKSYQWLFRLSMGITIFYAIALVKNVLKFSSYDFISEWIRILLLLFELGIISWYLFKALSFPELFRNIDSKLKLVEYLVFEESKVADMEITEAKYDENLVELKKYMLEEKPFLNPSLSIKNVSDDIAIPVRELSLLINHKLEQHFFDFINSYRIQEAMDILQDPLKKDITILEILYEVGFNSKSSFNTAFKKKTGITPTSFRKANI